MTESRSKSNMKRNLDFAKSKYPDLPVFESYLKVPFEYATINQLEKEGIIFKGKKPRPDAIVMKLGFNEYCILYLRSRFLMPEYID